ncbi:acetyl-CoA carboxylase biotin carboxyl carrier protein [Alterisphingorhabdus coralli]|uniref:Biotin carboxyl carrier protein of acetyl-CoA carboxylase n=1 Tax=Alterisphingorhabdus coralli TaxID=3071408 RepID=A0AA97F7J5_9SPHN|nr:biotin/lipoyl-containing protein [Parasphingorhabdus sp. SCSIO 66989]WOE75626.1 biotin/lipoyl-containing protein [Parasphingorhabdus sp. SCSIO 66989]
MAISRADIDAILATFEASDWRTIHLKADGVEVMLSKDGGPVPAPSSPSVAPPVSEPAQASPPEPPAEIDDGSIAIIAPSLGTFYRAPKPGAAPFTQPGARVEAGDDLCLIEVMKLFTSVTAPCSGTVTAILASDGDLVEHGQTLLRIKPDDEVTS